VTAVAAITVTIMIGGEAVVVPPVASFAALKRAWPAIQAFETATDPVELAAAAIRLVGAALARSRPELTPEELEERVGVGEIAGLVDSVPSLLRASGLIPVGEPQAPAPAQHSTETSIA
jgi:hypothetical protein